MSKILLLNPPGDRLYLRDSYCSKVSKAAYLTPPIDLLVISGYLSGRHQILVLDSMAERLSFGQSLDRIAELQPEYVVSLFGLASIKNDLEFFELVKRRLSGIKLLVSGDAGFQDTEKLLRDNPWVDAVLLDYSSPEWLGYLDGRRAGLGDIAYLENNVYSSRRSQPRREYSIGLPRLELFPYRSYRMPFSRSLPYAGVVTDFGCPFKCDFCLIGQLPYKLRPVNEVIEELLHLKELGIKYFSFGDQTFGAYRERTARLLNGIIAANIGLPWGCFARADLLDDGSLTLMKQAGCDLVMIGVESGDQAMLDRYHKNTRLSDIRRAFALCRQHGIRTVATFILGLPGETETSARLTMDLALELDPDFASFNVPAAKPLTPLAETAARSGWLKAGQADQSGSANVLAGDLTPEQIEAWRREAVKRFYLRPGYLLKRLRSISTFTELGINLAEAASLMKGQP